MGRKYRKLFLLLIVFLILAITIFLYFRLSMKIFGVIEVVNLESNEQGYEITFWIEDLNEEKIVKMKPNDELIYYDENLSASTVEIKDIWKWIGIGEYFVLLDVKKFTSDYELLELYED
ncbi:hypothetical protein [Alkalihalobacillus trypoxylicola]|uniref:Uncharacterized protein n=1 Tax=Alkalihalobacillus trypoxylicola TaxID=519424 RepID=A0A162DMN8_9BACI|nr:hypothetical protein [Alkalihalobacillus trypoxylicola]KYG30044.1 hypothetical protein AZF04_20075 [Alkalihalobacillus trypoxylicola]